jgi:hypothetical protein
MQPNEELQTHATRIKALTTVLGDLLEMIARGGGFYYPEDQNRIRRAERVQKGGRL